MSVAFQSAGRCVCLDEGCNGANIPEDYTIRNIDVAKQIEVTIVRCPSCNKQWEITRKLDGGSRGVGSATFTLITDERKRKSFDRKREALFGNVQLAVAG